MIIIDVKSDLFKINKSANAKTIAIQNAKRIWRLCMVAFVLSCLVFSHLRIYEHLFKTPKSYRRKNINVWIGSPFLEVKFSNWKIKLDKLWTSFFILMSDVNKTKWNYFERLVELVFFRQYFLDQMILSDWSKSITLFYCVRDWFDWFQNYILSKCTQKIWMLKTIYNKTNERINKETHNSHFYWLYKIDNKFRS